jgi:type 1 glutamine amidotransferase
MTLNRRQLLLAAGAATLGVRGLRAQDKGPTKRVLFFTKSSGFQHSVITRKGEQASHAERILTDLGKERGFEVHCSKDGRLFDPDKIGQWDVFAFETTGDLTTAGPHNDGHPMSADGKKAFLDAIHSGKGFVGMHCASDTFHSKGDEIDPYVRMIGGEFAGHGSQQDSTIRIVDSAFPGAREFGSDSFHLLDEWYTQKNWADDLHVILAQVTEGMKKTGGDRMYDRPDFPETWLRNHGKGRVFYTSMGHREDVWSNPKYQGLLLGALKWATGQADADTSPNVEKATPGYKKTSA